MLSRPAAAARFDASSACVWTLRGWGIRRTGAIPVRGCHGNSARRPVHQLAHGIERGESRAAFTTPDLHTRASHCSAHLLLDSQTRTADGTIWYWEKWSPSQRNRPGQCGKKKKKSGFQIAFFWVLRVDKNQLFKNGARGGKKILRQKRYTLADFSERNLR